MSKKSTWPFTGLGNRGHLKVINNTKLIEDDQGDHFDSFKDQFGNIQNLQRSSIGQISNWSGTFLGYKV